MISMIYGFLEELSALPGRQLSLMAQEETLQVVFAPSIPENPGIHKGQKQQFSA